jgi:hypothetical protein
VKPHQIGVKSAVAAKWVRKKFSWSYFTFAIHGPGELANRNSDEAIRRTLSKEKSRRFEREVRDNAIRARTFECEPVFQDSLIAIVLTVGRSSSAPIAVQDPTAPEPGRAAMGFSVLGKAFPPRILPEHVDRGLPESLRLGLIFGPCRSIELLHHYARGFVIG